MSRPPKTKRRSAGGPLRMPHWCVVLLLSCTAMATSSCVNCCPDERTTPPPEAAFVKLDLPGSAKGPAFPTWRTQAPGEPILLLHALNGISPSVLHWALEMESWGYRIYIPSLYGDPIEGESAYGWDKGIAATKFLSVNPQWELHSTTHPGAIIEDIRALARGVSALESGRDITVIGNCLTGIFPLAILDEPSVRLAVISQPALPVLKIHEILFRIPQSKKKQRALPLSPEHLDPILEAIAANPSKRIAGFHYAHDPVAPIAKFDQLHETLADAGLSDRFTAYVMEKPGASYVSERPDWVVGSETEQRRKMLTPHSTLSNPESLDDRTWFRDQLRRELDQASE